MNIQAGPLQVHASALRCIFMNHFLVLIVSAGAAPARGGGGGVFCVVGVALAGDVQSLCVMLMIDA